MSDGSMRGSGVGDTDFTSNLTCGNIDCIFDGDVDGTIDEYGVLHLTCPKCGRAHEIEADEVTGDDPDYRPGD